MTKFIRTSKILLFALSFVLFASSLASFVQLKKILPGHISLLIQNENQIQKTSFLLDGITRDLTSAPASGRHRKQDRGKENRAVDNILLYMFAFMVFAGDKSVVRLIVSFVGILFQGFTSFSDKRSAGLAPKIKFYIWWSLRFLTPLDKWMRTMSEQMDINPNTNNGRVPCAITGPHNVFKNASCGLFLCRYSA